MAVLFKYNKLILTAYIIVATIATAVIINIKISNDQAKQIKQADKQQNFLFKKAAQQNKAKQLKKRSRSVVSFFLTQPQGASLAIFSDWEGHYRLEENGNQANFVYLSAQKSSQGEKKSPLIFSIITFSLPQWKKIKQEKKWQNAQVLKQEKNAVFIAKIPVSSNTEKKFIKMRDDLDKILPTLRVFKLK